MTESRAIDVSTVLMTQNPKFDESFTTLMRDYSQSARAFCARMLGSLDEGEEVTQKTFARLYEQQNDLSTVENVRPYLFGVLRNACFDHLRSRQALDQHELPREAVEFELSGLEREEINVEIHKAVTELEASYREVVLLRFFEGLSLAEVAQVTESSVGAVAMKLSRAKATLKSLLKGLPVFRDL